MLTLVDLLLQLLFLGLLGFAVSAVAMRGGDKKVPVSAETLRRLDSIAIAEGYSNVAQLTDALTRLAPIRDMGKLSAMAKQTGGADSVVRIVEQALR
ncbi:hypothetical protein EBR44_14300, partial [bacterium]|nr:hypothetical protein [bacterium]